MLHTRLVWLVALFAKARDARAARAEAGLPIHPSLLPIDLARWPTLR